MNEWNGIFSKTNPRSISVTVDGVELKPGDLVRLRPRKGGDIMDWRWRERSPSSKPSSRITKASPSRGGPGRRSRQGSGMLRQPGHRFFLRPGRNRAA